MITSVADRFAAAFLIPDPCPLIPVCFLFAVPGTVRLGSLRLPVFGIYAAAGLVGALALSQRTAPRVGLDRDAVWDTGFAAAIAAFVSSRLMLIATDPRGFARYPLLVLSLPSLTWTGLLLTVVFTWLWLRWKRLPVLAVMDAWAAPACLLLAVLAYAHWHEGTAAGMPTAMPWGVYPAGNYVLGRVQPVQLFSICVDAALGAWAWWLLPRRRFTGEAAAWTLTAGGLAAFLLDFLRQPELALPQHGLPLDSGQFGALAAFAAGLWLLMSAIPKLGHQSESTRLKAT